MPSETQNVMKIERYFINDKRITKFEKENTAGATATDGIYTNYGKSIKKLAHGAMRLNAHNDIANDICERAYDNLVRLLLRRQRNRVRHDELFDIRLIDALHGWVSKHRRLSRPC